MTRKLIYLLIVPIFTFITFSCLDDDVEYEPPEMVTEIVPKADEDDYASDVYNGSLFNGDSEKPLIDIAPDEVLISTLNANLDLDSSEEQIVIIKKRAETDGLISIVVADYSNVTSTYMRVWESTTLANNIRSFMVHLDDLIGDHNNEIVCSGRDSEGNTTIDVFWKNTSDNNLGYEAIFNKSAKGTIEINQQERSRGYHQGLKDGVSYTITLNHETYDSENNLNLLKTVYYWDFPLRKYTVLSSEKLESTDINKTRLSEIIEGDEIVFFDFIFGPWVKDEQIIFFDSKQQLSTFYADDIQENYSWINSYKVMSNLLYTRCRNDIINYIENEIYVRVIDLDEIRVTVRDIDNQTHKKSENDIWTGTYTRMNSDMQTNTVKDLFSVIDESSLPVLSGQYISDSGDTIEFYGSNFFLKNSFEEISGGFAVYSSDFDILNLKLIDDKGIVYEERAFAIDYQEEEKEASIERTLVLTPGTLSIYGFHVSDTEFFRFSQTETLEIISETEQNQ